MAAAVSCLKSSPGNLDQLKMIVGSVVYGPRSRSIGVPDETKKKPVIAPTRIRGAVSPMARAIERTVPVRIPGVAYGSTWLLTTCHFVAPTAEPASRGL